MCKIDNDIIGRISGLELQRNKTWIWIMMKKVLVKQVPRLSDSVSVSQSISDNQSVS